MCVVSINAYSFIVRNTATVQYRKCGYYDYIEIHQSIFASHVVQSFIILIHYNW
jgi:hypothetical protein